MRENSKGGPGHSIHRRLRTSRGADRSSRGAADARLSLLRRHRVVTLASGHASMMVSSLNLYLAKPSIPVRVVGIISEAVLVVQLFRNLIEGVGDLVHATRFNQPAPGFFSQLS